MTDISGELGGLIIGPAGNPYHLIADARVSDGSTFSALPGTEIRADGFFEIRIAGIINFNEVLFTSNQPVPAKGDWKGIMFDRIDPSSVFANCSVNAAVFGVSIPFRVVGIPSIEMSLNAISGNSIGIFWYHRPRWVP